MGMYTDVYGGQVTMSGLLATAVVEQASCYNFQGVPLCEHDGELYIEEGVVVLSRNDVQFVVQEMRSHLLDGWAGKCVAWDGKVAPLTNLQDIQAYSQDVRAFRQLACWLANTDSDELVWSA